MFEIGWTEMLVIAIVMIVVVGPKDLPKMLRTFGRTTAKLRSMAGDFQRQFNEALKEAELDDVKKSVDSLRSLNPMNEIRQQLSPFEKAAADVRAGVDTAMKPTATPDEAAAPAQPADPLAQPGTSSVQPAEPLIHPAEPLKNGPTVMLGAADTASVPAPVAPPTPASSEPAAVESKKPDAKAAAKKPKANAAARKTAGNAS